MSWTANDIPDQTGRFAVVTGANGGLGYETALALSAKGAVVVMAVRDQGKAAAAHDRILEAHPDASLHLVPLDLAVQASVRSAAATISETLPFIDLLVNNAGLMAMPERRTSDGFEMQFGVNHLGHWTLTSLLLPSILASEAAGRSPRVVTLTSTARFMGPSVDPDNPNLEGNYRPWRAYAQAKLANYHFGLGLARQFDAAGLDAASLIAHPGLSNTDLQAHAVGEGGAGTLGQFFHRLTTRVGMTPEQGARMQLRAATDPDAGNGELYAPRFATAGPAVKRPILRRLGLESKIDTLWSVSNDLTDLDVDVAAARSLPGR